MMEKGRKKQKISGAAAVLITFIVLILISTALLFLPEKKPTKKNAEVSLTPAPTQAAEPVVHTTEVLAVVLETDTEIKMCTVYNVEEEEEQKLVYTGATTFFDGYGIQKTAAQLEAGGLYRFTIDTREEWITTACEAVDRRENPENTEVWEKTGVEYLTISEEMLSFRGQNYRYSEGLCVMNNGTMISLSELQPALDVLTIRGIGQTVYEIEVTKGHGYLALEHHEDFIGGRITIGNTKIESVTEEALYLVREGTYLVTVECGDYAGKEQITVLRDETAVFDVFEYGSGPIKKGWLTIKIDPLGADLTIDGVKTAYTDGIELEYGTYQFEFAEGGYISYQATVLIDQPKQSLSVFLTEQPSSTEDPDDGDTTTNPSGSGTASGEEPDEDDTGTGDGNTSGTDTDGSGLTSVSILNLGYELNRNNAIYILGPSNAEIYLDGEYLGTAPMDFEKIIGSYVITVIRTDGEVKNFNCSETDNGEDSYYNFSWAE